MSHAHEPRLIQDFLGQRDMSLPTSTPHAGALVHFFQPIPYAEAWTLQKQFQEGRITERQVDVLMLLEHPPIYTLGRSTQAAHWDCGIEALRRTGASVQSVDRGGSITYHGPGQVVGYPILKLSHYCAGPKQYVRKLEEVLIHTLLRWGITGYRIENKPGVWVHRSHADAKIASIGVRIDHGVTSHGFALNVDLDLAPFSQIMPCGLTQGTITSMAEIRQSAVSVSVVMEHIAQVFARVFKIRWTNLPDDVMGKKLHDDYHLTSASPLCT